MFAWCHLERKELTMISHQPAGPRLLPWCAGLAFFIWAPTFTWSFQVPASDRGLVAPDDPVFAITFSKDGQWLALACGDKTAQIYSWKTSRLEKVLRGHKVRLWSVSFAPDGKTLASCSGEYS